MHGEKALLGLIILAAAYGETRAASKAEEGGTVTLAPEAAAWHGAMVAYQRLAAFFGRQALRAEVQYWKAVRA